MKLPVCVLLLVAIAKGVLASNINPYIPVLVVPKNPIIKCPSSCSNARDCFFVHPLSENHFYSCFHGKAMVHQCPNGKSFSDERHQCVAASKASAAGASITALSNARIAELTEKIVLFEHLIDKFQRKMEKVQKVIIESDNKIGLLGKFLLKALKSNRENYCNKGGSSSGATANAAAAAIPVEPEPHEMELDDQVENDGRIDMIGDEGINVAGFADSPKAPNANDAKVEASPKNGTELAEPLAAKELDEESKSDDAGKQKDQLTEIAAKEDPLDEVPAEGTANLQVEQPATP